mmetsp:Transcript_66352/g.194192  ORF Transcript_66352/g.194192 Transcript_66352/m.194192 type:complete len:281 (+) Transcript_66352:2322-3164(+)
MLVHLLLSSLHAHCHARDQDVTVRHEDLRILHNEPRTSRPELVHPLRFREVEGALHADDGLLVLAHGQLLQVIVRLEHDLPKAGAHEPLWLEALLLHGAVTVFLAVQGVQRELRLPASLQAHLECQREVLQVDACCWLCSLHNAHCARFLVERQAAQAVLGGEIVSQLACRARVPRRSVRSPADAVLLALLLLLGGHLLLPGLLLLVHLSQGAQGKPLCMWGCPAGSLTADGIREREPALVAAPDLAHLCGPAVMDWGQWRCLDCQRAEAAMHSPGRQNA